MSWTRKSEEEIKARVFGALKSNVDYSNSIILGLPASFLDTKVFYNDATFLKEAPYLSTLVHNPNHIGCHTVGNSEHYFSGTQDIEREVIAICSEDILGAGISTVDGYVSAGGTEANMQAIWIYRNYFLQKCNYQLQEIALICSSDSHYSMAKSANILQIQFKSIAVEENERSLLKSDIQQGVRALKNDGIKGIIVVSNMMTTMFGSVDSVADYTSVLEEENMPYCLHVDAAYGGFYYPIVQEIEELSFKNPKITSFTLDAHKMVQAPYGTGIFLIRKGWMDFARTDQASYVEGEDCTISGSRSGANAVAIWMILSKYGKLGWYEKMHTLQHRADWITQQLDKQGIRYFRAFNSNIITIKANDISQEIAARFGLVPDNHSQPNWYKIVVMEHVTREKLELFVQALSVVVVES